MNECGDRVLFKNVPVVINSGRKKITRGVKSISVVSSEEAKNVREREKSVLIFSPENGAKSTMATTPHPPLKKAP